MKRKWDHVCDILITLLWKSWSSLKWSHHNILIISLEVNSQCSWRGICPEEGRWSGPDSGHQLRKIILRRALSVVSLGTGLVQNASKYSSARESTPQCTSAWSGSHHTSASTAFLSITQDACILYPGHSSFQWGTRLLPNEQKLRIKGEDSVLFPPGHKEAWRTIPAPPVTTLGISLPKKILGTR